ncbi:hypothetical protein PRUB_a0170 [Pseudoalteromonas rubra]|uniref:Uncharacterized protein n=1 Tax=Pseudoalteromonas rubra TaxID=43658 RepID=A0A8T0C534_9GAMM|nr:hypothetical protein PRUB_a0170 [Pseudoalteromonas rubra]
MLSLNLLSFNENQITANDCAIKFAELFCSEINMKIGITN